MGISHIDHSRELIQSFVVFRYCQDTRGALAPCSGFLPSRPARRPSAVHDARWFTLVIRVHQAPRGKFGENPLTY